MIACDEQGREIVLSVIGPGEYFGEMAALDGGPRSATIVTKEPSEILIIHKDGFSKSSSRETASRTMKELQDAGYITIEEKQITISRKLV